MAYARQANRGIPVSAFFIAVTLVAIMVVAAMVGTGTLNLFGAEAPTIEQAQPNPALIQAEQEWVRQRLEQSGYGPSTSGSNSAIYDRLARHQAATSEARNGGSIVPAAPDVLDPRSEQMPR